MDIKKENFRRSPQQQSEDTKNIRDQFSKTIAAFRGNPKTMLQVSIETGIRRANICRYVAKMRKQDIIYLDRKGLCPISKCRAGFYQSCFKKGGYNGK